MIFLPLIELSKRMILIKTLIFTFLVPGTVSIVIPAWLLFSRSGPTSLELGIVRYLGVLPILLGAWIYAWCAWDFTFAGRGTPAPIDPPRELVVRGLYNYVRNPMYVGILSILFGEALFFQAEVLFEYAGRSIHLFSSVRSSLRGTNIESQVW